MSEKDRARDSAEILLIILEVQAGEALPEDVQAVEAWKAEREDNRKLYDWLLDAANLNGILRAFLSTGMFKAKQADLMDLMRKN